MKPFFLDIKLITTINSYRAIYEKYFIENTYKVNLKL